MKMHSDIETFYALLGELTSRNGGRRRLGDCNGHMQWPTRGVYFFFEPGEYRNGSTTEHRVVRVGTHALTARSRTTIWNRLSQHRGTLSPQGGNHRGSIFRLLVGEALMRKTPELALETWGRGSSASREVRQQEYEHERRVSQYLANTTVLVLPISDPAGANSLRATLEKNSIALLSASFDPVSRPNVSWLGHYSGRERVRRSGLWNNRHVDESYDPSFLNLLERFVRQL